MSETPENEPQLKVQISTLLKTSVLMKPHAVTKNFAATDPSPYAVLPGPDPLHQCVVSSRPRCFSVTEKTPSRPCTVPAWPDST